jgi:TrmH family RNA methyltransferase
MDINNIAADMRAERLMLTKETIKFVKSLTDKKNRTKSGLFVAEGDKLVADLMESKIQVKTLFTTHEWADAHVENLQNITTEVITAKQMDQLSQMTSTPAVIALCNIPQPTVFKGFEANQAGLVLDRIQDPGNLGTIMRIADWYGIKHLFLSPGCADAFQNKVVQSTMGSIARVHLYETDLQKLFLDFPNTPVFAAAMQGKALYEHSFPASGFFLLIGNEGAGLDNSLTPYISQHVTIPKAGKAESLNAAVACAVMCDAWNRQAFFFAGKII